MVRERYNKEHNPLDFMFIMRTTTNGMPRYNRNGEFNNSFHITRNGITPNRLEKIIFEWSDLLKENNVEFIACSYEEIKPQKRDFVYLDPPYANTTATYNENNGWTEEDENALYSMCERLNGYGIRFGMSNVFENKGVKNQRLIDWCNQHDWNIYTFDKFTYMACGKGNSNAKEVFITNY